MQVQSMGWEDSLEEGMATPSSILKWRAWQPTPVLWKIPWTEEPCGLQSMASQKS